MKPALICIAVTVFLVGVLVFVYNGRHQPAPKTYWKDTGIACLPNGHQNLAMHIHATLEIFVNGNQEVIPANIGVTNDCLAEVHTHEANNLIHIETGEPSEPFTLGDFYRVWEQDSNRLDLGLEMFVNGQKVQGPPDAIVLEDGQKVRLEYTSAH